MFLSSNWLGHYSFTVAIRVQIPLRITNNNMVDSRSINPVIYIRLFLNKNFKANITQLVRVLDCGSKSRRFESCYSPPIIIYW